MNRQERLEQAYQIQKNQFDDAERRKLVNLRKQYNELKAKRDKITAELNLLATRINNPKQFATFEEFLQNCEKPSKQQKEDQTVL